MLDTDKEAILNGNATIRYKISFDDNELNEYDIINTTYEDYRYVDSDSLVIGQFVARTLSGEIDTLDKNLIIEDKDINVQMGIITYNTNENQELTNWYDLGNFLITKPSDDDVKDKLSFNAMDYAKKFNQSFNPDLVTFPCTAKELALNVCNQCGVELATLNFKNADFVITNNQYTENEMCRKVMQDIGKLAYSWIRIGWDNKCYIDFELDTDEIDNNNVIHTNEYYDLSLQKLKFGPVNRVVIGMKDVEGENFVVEDKESIKQNGVTEIRIYDNNLTYTPELREQVSEQAKSLFGLEYIPLEITTVGHPWLLGNKRIKVINTKNEEFVTYPWDRTIEYKGHIKSRLASKGATRIETQYRNTGGLENELRKTRIIVDKSNQNIEALAERVIDVSTTVTGTDKIVLKNASEGTLHHLEITGDIQLLFPSDDLFPSNYLYPLDSYLLVDNEKYHLDIDYLNYINSKVCDKYIYEDGKQWIERNVGENTDGSLYALETPIIEKREDVVIKVKRDSNISMESFNNIQLSSTYLLENEYTNNFVPTVDVISRINLAPGEATIESRKLATITAEKINLQGYTTINNGFGVDLEGNMFANNGSFSGNIFLQNGNKVIGGDGLLSNLQYISNGTLDNGFDLLGFKEIDYREPYGYADVKVDCFIPKNFTIVEAYLTLYTSSISVFNANNDFVDYGICKNLKLYKGYSDYVNDFYVAPSSGIIQHYSEINGTEIVNGLDGKMVYTPPVTNGYTNAVKSINIASELQEGRNILFVRTTLNQPNSPESTNLSTQPYLDTGVGKIVVDIIGYMSFDIKEENK